MTPESEPDDAHALLHRKTRDRAFILPLIGLILLMPPVAGIFEVDAKVAGVPFTVIYLFAVWAALIAGTARLARALRDNTDSHRAPRPEALSTTSSDDG